jgi:DNA-binding MarR family transcriptional regulator
MRFTSEQLKGFSNAAQSLKLYRRAELVDEQSGKQMISELYVDPLPQDAVLNGILKPNTTFLIGRKGTGKSTIFQRAQAEIRGRKGAVSAYVDIKTTFEESQVDTSILQKLPPQSLVMTQAAVEKLLLYRGFLLSVLTGIRDQLKQKLRESLWTQIKESFTGTIEELFEDFDSLIADANADKFVDVLAAKTIDVKGRESQKQAAEASASLAVTAKGPEAKIKAGGSAEQFSEDERKFSEVLLKTFNVKQLLLSLKQLLERASIRHLYIFVDDFSELPEEAMHVVVDTLIAPLNNWSEEFIKFKIAAYPGRIYFGQIDKTKVDETYLDLFQMYGGGDVNSMESKAADFVRRLVTSRLTKFCGEPPEYFFETRLEDPWRVLFFASMGNPRTLGYLLFFLYESALIYQKGIGLQAIRESARRFYEEKLEPYFEMNKFLHESFAERSSIFSLKELLEQIVNRARELRHHRDSDVMKEIQGRPPTSHFHVVREFESVFTTLELNFFVSKYFEMADRAGRKVVVYALNYGLCQKYTIEFGRPVGQREFRLYFVERIFDYSPLVKAHIEANQEIVCDTCGTLFGMDKLPALKEYGMLCPKCHRGKCTVTNLSRKYEATLRAVDDNLLLRPTELGILRTLKSEEKPLYAGDIAAELDCSYQLVGRRAKNLAEQGLVNRDRDQDNRREFSLTEQAQRAYFSESKDTGLDVSEAP